MLVPLQIRIIIGDSADGFCVFELPDAVGCGVSAWAFATVVAVFIQIGSMPQSTTYSYAFILGTFRALSLSSFSSLRLTTPKSHNA